ARLVVRDSGKVLTSRDIVLQGDGAAQTESVLFNAGDAGVKNLQFSIDALPEEENKNNNSLTRVLYVDNAKPRVLYMEGEPRWDYKFIRRAVEDDKNIDLYTVVRTTQNKLYTQVPTDAPSGELKDGFPTKVDDLFAYQGIILGTIEANYFTPAQQDLIQQFVDRRGGGLLFLGGRTSLADGGYEKPPFSDLLPVRLPDHKNTFHREPASAELTQAGRESLITRIEDNPDANVERWKKLPYLMDFQEAGVPKPGALVLANMKVAGSSNPLPLLITEKFGRGRTAVFATGGDWRWQMLQPVADMSHELFWRQLLRWLVSDTPTRVVTSVTRPVVYDDGRVHLRAEVRDTTFLPTSDAQIQARIVGPDGNAQSVDLHPDSLEQGVYSADWDAGKAGSYVAEITASRGQQELGRDVITFRREDGVAENFHLEQNRDLLEKLSSQTGGKYYRPNQVTRLGEDISYSDAGITVRETRDLWDMPIVFFVVLLLCCTEWVLRRRWGVV
ncbi:MAG TPA: glutamine amidotransferase, partial [Bryobacteraceae bacterium]|nr:glutamine amidotransferase [Bryobacteraceae bacterium]